MSESTHPMVAHHADAACPRCKALRSPVSDQPGSGAQHVEFDCGSWWDAYSSPWWDAQCYRNRGVEGLRELVVQRAYSWFHIDRRQGKDLVASELEEAVMWLDEALDAVNEDLDGQPMQAH